ncbi:MAG: hypothetical protein WAZ34_14435 [Rhodocyclaceae bacterium]
MSEVPDETTFQRLLANQKTEARAFLTDVLRMRGLMPLLMKNRNGGAWTSEERTELLAQLRTLSRISPYLLFLMLPGSALLLPAYAWWLDRRRKGRTTLSSGI